jgi:hypothetical protein
MKTLDQIIGELPPKRRAKILARARQLIAAQARRKSRRSPARSRTRPAHESND